MRATALQFSDIRAHNLELFFVHKAVNRWQVPELAGMIRSFKEAQENKNTAIRNFKSKVYADFDTDREVWLRAVRVMAEVWSCCT